LPTRAIEDECFKSMIR